MYKKNVSEKDWKRQVEMGNKNDLDFFHFEELLKYEKNHVECHIYYFCYLIIIYVDR